MNPIAIALLIIQLKQEIANLEAIIAADNRAAVAHQVPFYSASQHIPPYDIANDRTSGVPYANE